MRNFPPIGATSVGLSDGDERRQQGGPRRYPRNEWLINAGRPAQVSRQPSIFAFGFADRTYFRLLSRAAQAWDTPESAALLPGITAQPPFST